MVTYFPYYFDALGLSAAMIGAVFSGRTILGIIAQPALTQVADRIGHPRWILALSMVIAALSALALQASTNFGTAALSVWVAAPGLAAMIPLLDALVVTEHGVERYGRIRLWGSIGYGVMVTGFGLAVGELAHARAGALSIGVYASLAVAGVIATLSIRPPKGAVKAGRTMAKFSPGVMFIPFLVANGLHWSSVMISNVYLSLHLRDAGMATWVPGVAVGVAIIAEIGAFFVAGRLGLDRQARRWFSIVCLSGVFRWLVTAWAPNEGVVIAMQAIHFVSFGVWISLAIRMLGRFAPLERRGTLQGVFTAVSFGGGGLLGGLAGGALMDAYGGTWSFVLAAALEACALVVFLAFWRHMPSEPAAD